MLPLVCDYVCMEKTRAASSVCLCVCVWRRPVLPLVRVYVCVCVWRRPVLPVVCVCVCMDKTYAASSVCLCVYGEDQCCL